MLVHALQTFAAVELTLSIFVPFHSLIQNHYQRGVLKSVHTLDILAKDILMMAAVRTVAV